MLKVLRQGFVLAAVFLASWAALSQVNWVGLVRAQRVSDSAEARLGEFVWKSLDRNGQTIRTPAITAPLDTLRARLCKSARLNHCPSQVHVVRDEEVNAFALPGKRVLVTTALLQEVRNESELAGVLAHEFAHVELGHVMNKLVKEIGLAVLVSSGGGSEVVQQVLHSLSSSAYDRRQETNADLFAVDVLIDVRISPRPLADLTFRLGQRDGEIDSRLRWLSTHPSSEERALAIVERARDAKVDAQPAITPESWASMKSAVSSSP
jgi:predicted Zn-dependent protease